MHVDRVVTPTSLDLRHRTFGRRSDGESVINVAEDDVQRAEFLVGDGADGILGEFAARHRGIVDNQRVHPGAALDIDRQRKFVVKCQHVLAGAKVAGNGLDAVVGLAIVGSGESRFDLHLFAGLFGQGVALVAHPGADIAPAGEGTHVECQLSSFVIPRGKPRRFIGEDTSWDSDRSNRPTAAYVAKKRTNTSLGPQ